MILILSKKPVFGKVSEKGAATFVKNTWLNCERLPQKVIGSGGSGKPLSSSEELLSGSFKPAYSYKADAVADIPSMVKNYAGVGKISTDENGSTSNTMTSAIILNRKLVVDVKDHQVVIRGLPGTSINIYNALGSKLYSGKIGKTGLISFLMKNGFYFVKAGLISKEVLVHF